MESLKWGRLHVLQFLAAGIVAVFAALLVYGFSRESHLPLAPRHGERPNPWRGLPGCLWVTEGAVRYLWSLSQGDPAACAVDGLEPLPAAARPPHATAFVTALQPWIGMPPNANPALQAEHGRGRVVQWGRHARLQGANLELTFKPAEQAAGQALADCMAGTAQPCSLKLPPGRWQHFHENSALRMLGAVQVDVETGEVDMAVSSHTRCYEDDALARHTGDCPFMTHAPARAQPWRLDNHGLYASAMPGSIFKGALALALHRSDLGAWLGTAAGEQWLASVLQRSDTAALLDMLYCKDKAFKGDCQRVRHLPQAAADLGLDGTKPAGLLGGGDALTVPPARMFMEATQDGWQFMRMPAVNPVLSAQCSANRWQRCAGQELALQTAELWGTGNTAASPLAAARMLVRLANAADGQEEAPQIHLASRALTGRGELAPEPPQPHRIDPRHARSILRGMGLTHRRGGTAHAACVAATGRAAECERIDWLSGKTGTPGFEHEWTFEQRHARCTSAREELQAGARHRQHAAAQLARCAMPPVKWYVGLTRSAATGRWSKAIAVVAERQWLRTSGKVDPGNPAAEFAFRYLTANRKG